MTVAKKIKIDDFLVGKKCIIRTYSAGVHFGTVTLKENDEIILSNARRLWYWKTANRGISLSEVAIGGLHSDSKVCSPVLSIYLKAVEIIPCTELAIQNIENQNEYRA